MKRRAGIDTKPELVFVERAPHENGFAAYFDKHIKPKLEDLENRRLRARAVSRKRISIAVGLGIGFIVVGAVLLSRFEMGWGWVIFGATIAVGFLYGMVQKPAEKYVVDRKRTVIPEVLKFVGAFGYDPDGGLSEEVLKASYLFESWDTCECEDLITGSYRGQAFAFAEVELSSEGSGFKGFIVWMEIERSEAATIAVKARGKALNLLDRFFETFKDLRQIPFDQSKFAGEFDVYSTNEAEARRIFTPHLVKMALELSRLREASKVELGVRGSNFLLEVETKRDLFEPVDVHESALTTEDSRKFLEELHDVLEIVETVGQATGSTAMLNRG